VTVDRDLGFGATDGRQQRKAWQKTADELEEQNTTSEGIGERPQSEIAAISGRFPAHGAYWKQLSAVGRGRDLHMTRKRLHKETQLSIDGFDRNKFFN